MEQASTLMGVSTRHTRRILAAYRKEGAAALAHGHRGRRAPNAISEATKTTVLHLARTRYSGTNHTHMSELLSEREGIDHNAQHTASPTGECPVRTAPVGVGLRSTEFVGSVCRVRAC